MYKFNINPKNDLKKFYNNSTFNEMFEYIGSGKIWDDVSEIDSGTKVGYIIDFRSEIDLDTDGDKYKDGYILNFEDVKGLFDSLSFGHMLYVKYQGIVYEFNLNVWIDSLNPAHLIGIPLTLNFVKNLVTGRVKNDLRVTSSLYVDSLYCIYEDSKVIDMCRFKYYKLKN